MSPEPDDKIQPGNVTHTISSGSLLASTIAEGVRSGSIDPNVTFVPSAARGDVKRDGIWSEVIFERYCQDEHWGGPAHDDLHNTRDWITILGKYFGRLCDRDLDGWKEFASPTLMHELSTLGISTDDTTSDLRNRAKSDAMRGKLKSLRRVYVKLAAISVAAIEWIDRRLQESEGGYTLPPKPPVSPTDLGGVREPRKPRPSKGSGGLAKPTVKDEKPIEAVST